MDGELNDQLESNSPNQWSDRELNCRLKKTCQTDGQMEINSRLENNSPNRWTDGESNDRLENNWPD